MHTKEKKYIKELNKEGEKGRKWGVEEQQEAITEAKGGKRVGWRGGEGKERVKRRRTKRRHKSRRRVGARRGSSRTRRKVENALLGTHCLCWAGSPP